MSVQASAAVRRGVRIHDLASALRGALRDARLDPVVAPGDGHKAAVIVTTVSPPVPVHRELVDAVVDLLHEAGWRKVVVASAVRVRDRDRGLTDHPSLAAQAGLRGTTRTGNPYHVADLHEDLVAAPVPESSVLSGQLVAAQWADAGLRVVLARSMTDLVDGYRGCLDTLLSVAHPVAGAAPADVAADLLDHLPPQLAIVDALVSSHGFAGSDVGRPLDTEALIAADDALVADVLTARLQAVDPGASRLVHEALARHGLPTEARVHGDLTPFAGWQNAPTLARDALQQSGTSVERIAGAVLSPPDAGHDPHDAIVTAWQQAAAAYTGTLDAPGMHAWADWTIAWTAYTLAAARQQAQAWATLFAPDRIDRVEVPLGFDPDAYSAAEYRSVAREAAGFERLLDGVPATDNGLRWTMLDRAVVFEVSRVVRVPFTDFVERVDVAAGISLMADYIGGRVVALDRDEQGRATRQAERNLYLTQPNYLAFWGGQPIDVCKIETVSYGDAEHRLVWRTVASPNRSATYDDGAMTFTDAGPGLTRVSVSGRQLFTLPPFWEAADLDRFPDYKAVLVEDAYRRFFETTFDNLEACYEGREFRIGREPADPARPLPTEVLSGLLRSAGRNLAETSRPGTKRAAATDADGFRHFSGDTTAATAAAPWVSEWQHLVTDYLAAAGSDWARMLRS